MYKRKERILEETEGTNSVKSNWINLIETLQLKGRNFIEYKNKIKLYTVSRQYICVYTYMHIDSQGIQSMEREKITT